MTTLRSLVWVLTVVGMALALPVEAKDGKLPRVKPSKVDRSLGKEREAKFGKWMKSGDFKLEVATRMTKGEKLLYFECEGVKDEWRGIFVRRTAQESPYFMAVYGEEAAAQRIAEYAALGYEPRFVVVNKNYWCFTLSKGPGTETEAADLAKLGIGAPEVK